MISLLFGAESCAYQADALPVCCVPSPCVVNFKMFYFYFICKSILPECMHLYHYVPGAHREQERALNTMELEFQMVVSHCLGAGN